MQEILLKIRYFQRRLLKTFKKLTLFFLLNSVLLMDKLSKKVLELVTSYSSGMKQTHKKLFISYILYDQV